MSRPPRGGRPGARARRNGRRQTPSGPEGSSGSRTIRVPATPLAAGGPPQGKGKFGPLATERIGKAPPSEAAESFTAPVTGGHGAQRRADRIGALGRGDSRPQA